MAVARFKIKHETNFLGQRVGASLQQDDRGNLVGYDDYDRLEKERDRYKSQLEESLKIHRGSTEKLRERIKRVLSDYDDHKQWPE